MNKQIKSSLILMLTAIIWGFAFVAQRVGADNVSAFTYNGIRFFLGAASLIPVALLFERAKIDRARLMTTVISGLIAGVVLFSASALQQYSFYFDGVTSGKAGFITGLYTVLVPIFGIFLKKRTGLVVWLGAVSAVIGLYFICITNEGFTIDTGTLMLLLGAVLWAVHILILDHFSSKVYSLRFSMTQFFTCAAINLILAAIFEREAFSFESLHMALIPILYGGLMSVGVAYTLQIIGQKDAEPTSAAIILSCESLFSAIGGALILHETMSWRGYLGCVLIFLGIILSQLQGKIRFGKQKKLSEPLK